jgi:hypothetical protein
MASEASEWTWRYNDASAELDRSVLWLAVHDEAIPLALCEVDEFCKAWQEYRKERFGGVDRTSEEERR